MKNTQIIALFAICISFSSVASFSSEESGQLYGVSYRSADTFYYHFYDDVQLIEIDFHRSYMLVHQLGGIQGPSFSSMRTRGGLWQKDNVLLFRNRRGEIVKRYNDDRNEINADDLEDVASITEFNYHNRPRNRSSYGVNSLEYSPSTYVIKENKIVESSEDEIKKTVSFFGLIDSVGNIILESKYISIYVSGSYYFVDNGEAQGALNFDLSEFIPQEYSTVQPSTTFNGNFEIRQGDLWGMLDKHGSFLLEPKYTSYRIQDRTFFVKIGEKEGVMSLDGEELVPIELDAIHPFYKIYVVVKNDKYGIMNSEFELLVNYTYDDLRPSKKGLDNYEVKLGDKWGLIHEDGKLLIPITYSDPSRYKNVKIEN